MAGLEVGPLGEWRERAVKVKQFPVDDSAGPEGEFLLREEDLSVSPSIHSPRTIYLISEFIGMQHVHHSENTARKLSLCSLYSLVRSFIHPSLLSMKQVLNFSEPLLIGKMYMAIPCAWGCFKITEMMCVKPFSSGPDTITGRVCRPRFVSGFLVMIVRWGGSTRGQPELGSGMEQSPSLSSPLTSRSAFISLVIIIQKKIQFGNLEGGGHIVAIGGIHCKNKHRCHPGPFP